jgi:carbon-monoxide dehydrogenase large subunit
VSSEMTKKYVGASILRNEDPRLLTGQAQFFDDIELPGMLHAAFYRSDYAHARIKSIDVSEARKLPGVVAVYTAEDFGDYWHIGPLQVPPPLAIKGAIFHARPLVPIAKDKVRYSGEPLAVILAESRYIAEDAIGLIFADLEPLPAVVDMEKALEPGATLIHEDLDSNLAADVSQESGNYSEAAAKADLVIKRRFFMDRCAGGAMENRGLVINWEDKIQKMTVYTGTQAPIPLRNSIARNLNLSEDQVRVVNPFVGGGFGPKVMTSMPDDVLLPWLSLKLKRPIKWVEDRRENFLATTAERDQIHYAEIALTKEGKILGLKDVFYHNTGAYDPYGMTVPLNTQTHTTGQYLVPNFYTQTKMVFTTKMVVTPVRGAGRHYGVFVMERLLDLAAKELKIDLVEIRRRNLIQPDQLPYKTGIIGQDFVENVLDSGNYPAAIQKAAEMIGYETFIKEEQPKLRAQGKKVGIGIVNFVEGTGVGPYEGCRITVGNNGKVIVLTGNATQGQAHFTTFAQIVADQIGVKVTDIHVNTADTDLFHWGAGTFASRGATVAGSAVHAAAVKVRAKALQLASKYFETPESELELVDGLVRVADIPGKSISLGDLAAKANPSRGVMEAGVEPGLEATAYYGPPHGATGYGSNAMIIEIDPNTYKVNILKFVFVHDCGTVINPMVAEGQIHGGIQMGIGNSFFEQLIYDENGQLLNASFMDYLMPRSTDMPMRMELGHICTPSPLNPLGIKGLGEAGAIPVPPAFIQAVENALADENLEILEAPLSPSMIFEYVRAKHAR